MAANTTPIAILGGDDQWASSPLTVANPTRDGHDGTRTTIYTAPANGGFVHTIRFQSLGVNPASVVRVWENNGSPMNTAANNTLVGEVALPAQQTASETDTAPSVEFAWNGRLKAGYVIFCTIGTACPAGWQPTVFADLY
jgi:hypothetical protein